MHGCVGLPFGRSALSVGVPSDCANDYWSRTGDTFTFEGEPLHSSVGTCVGVFHLTGG